MNILEPWHIVFLAGFAVEFWIRHVFFQRTKNEKKTVSRFDRSERILLGAMLAPVILLPVLFLFTPMLTFADYRLPTLVAWMGAVTMAASLWLFWRSHADLGQNWSVSLEIREGHQLVTQGVYRYIRHPMYASIWLWGIAQGMLLQNWLAGWAVLPVFAVMYFLRTHREEQMMCEAFGEQYRKYMRRTGRLFPTIKTESVAHAQKEEDGL